MNKKKLFSSCILFIASVALLFIGKGCGGGGGSNANLPTSVLPTVTAFTDSGGAALDGATNVSFTSLNLKFEKAVDLALLSTPGVVTITCDGLPASVAEPSFQIRAADNDADDGITGNEFTIDVADGYKYQLLSCTLSVAASVPSAGTSIAAKAAGSSATTAKFTNKCALSSDYNAGDKETACWRLNTWLPGDTLMPTWLQWEGVQGALGDVIEFNADVGTLDWYTEWNNLDYGFIDTMKYVVPDGGDLEMLIHFKSSVGTFNNAEKSFPTSIMMLILDSDLSGYLMAVGGLSGAGGTYYTECMAFYMVKGDIEDKVETLCDIPEDPSACRCDPSTTTCVSGNLGGCFGGEFYFKLVLSPATSTVEAYWSPNGKTDWTKFIVPFAKHYSWLPPDPVTNPRIPNLEYHPMEGDLQFGIMMIQTDMQALRDKGLPLPHASVDEIKIEGATNDRQY